MSNKPSWDTAPKFANYLAMDKYVEGAGEKWVWFEFKPEYDGSGWMISWDDGSDARWLQTDCLATEDVDAANSLEERP